MERELDLVVAGMFQVLAHSVQDVLNAVGDRVDAVDGQLGVGVVAPVQVGLGLQLRRAQISAVVGAAQGLLVLVQLPQRGLGQDVAFRPIRGFQHVGRRQWTLDQNEQSKAA